MYIYHWIIHICFPLLGCDINNIGGKDLVFVLDTSISLAEYYNQLRQFTTNITSMLDIGLEESLVGLILYSTDATIHFNLLEHTNVSTLLQALDTFPSTSGTSNTHLALSLLLRSAQNGRLGLREGRPHAAIIVTDGKFTSEEETLRQANQLRSANIFEVYAVGIGNVDFGGLNKIASSPSLVFTTLDFSFTTIEQKIIQQLCLCK